jgi:hypothetical protein
MGDQNSLSRSFIHPWNAHKCEWEMPKYKSTYSYLTTLAILILSSAFIRYIIISSLLNIPTFRAQAFLMDFTLGEWAIAYHAGPVRICGLWNSSKHIYATYSIFLCLLVSLLYQV